MVDGRSNPGTLDQGSEANLWLFEFCQEMRFRQTSHESVTLIWLISID